MAVSDNLTALRTAVGIAINDNTSGDITPADVRTSIIDTIDTLESVSVQKSLFDAHTILQATTDDTPVALSVPQQTVVGRITGGNITALTASQVRTLINVSDGATPDQNVFSQIAVSGQSNVVADSTTDTLTLVGSGNITITTNATTDTITIASTGDLVASNNLSDLTNAGTARTNLGLAIGTNVQAYSAVLAGTTASFTTALETKLNGGLVATNNLSDLTNATTARTNLGLAIGTNVQAYSAVLAGTTASFTTALETKLGIVPTSDITGITGADAVSNIVSLTQAEYDAIVTKSASTLYIIVG